MQLSCSYLVGRIEQGKFGSSSSSMNGIPDIMHACLRRYAQPVDLLAGMLASIILRPKGMVLNLIKIDGEPHCA